VKNGNWGLGIGALGTANSGPVTLVPPPKTQESKT
jgi:hypothetical protein